MKERVKDAIALINSNDFASLSLGVSELDAARPGLQEYVGLNPEDADGHMELSKTYQIPIFIAMKLETATDRQQIFGLLMQYIGKRKEYAEKGKFHLEEFCRLSKGDPAMINASRQVIQMLDNILKAP